MPLLCVSGMGSQEHQRQFLRNNNLLLPSFSGEMRVKQDATGGNITHIIPRKGESQNQGKKATRSPTCLNSVLSTFQVVISHTVYACRRCMERGGTFSIPKGPSSIRKSEFSIPTC